MTVHFFYEFKDELINKIKEEYSEELNERKKKLREQKQIDKAENLILEYFKQIKNALTEVIDVSKGYINYSEGEDYIVKFTVNKNSLKFTRNKKSIEIEVELYDDENDIVESKILGNIIVGEKSCIIKDTGKLHTGSHFDNKAIDYFMRVAFGDFLKK